MNWLLISASVLGLAFYEAVRAYRCVCAGRGFIPDSSTRPGVSVSLYICAIAVFVAVAIFAVYALAIMNPVIAFGTGFSIPTGSRLLTAAQALPGPDHVDDFASAAYGADPGILYWLRSWLTIYNA